jgi:cysteine desulfurase
MGLSHELAHGSLRFSLGRETTEEDIARVLEVSLRIIAKLRAMSPMLQSGT